MFNLAKREDLFEGLFDFRREFDELFNRLFSETPFVPERIIPFLPEVPAVEVFVDKEGKKYNLRVALPGIDPQNVQLNLQDHTLSINAERKEETQKKDVNYLRREFRYGKFDRMLTLPEGVDTEKLNAEYKNGVLEITAPMAATALPRRIEIKGAPKPKIAAA